MKNRKLISFLVALTNLLINYGCKLEQIPCPISVDRIEPTGAHSGDTVSIHGTGFRTDFSKKFYKISIGQTTINDNAVIDVKADHLRFVVPQGIGNGPITISLSTRGVVCGSLSFIYKYKVELSDISKPFASGFRNPQGLDVDADGHLYVADKNNHVIKKIEFGKNIASVFAGDRFGRRGYNNSKLSTSLFNSPTDIAVSESGIIYVVDNQNYSIRKIDGDLVSLLAGGGPPELNSPVYRDGALLNARFEEPVGIATNGRNILIITEPAAVRKQLRLINLDASGNEVSTFPTDINDDTFSTPNGVAYSDVRSNIRKDEYPIFIADAGKNQEIIGYNLLGSSTSIPTNLNISQPYDVVFDKVGNLFVLDKSTNRIIVIYTDNSMETIAGNDVNGSGKLFESASAIGIDKERNLLYISDEVAGTIIRIKYQ